MVNKIQRKEMRADFIDYSLSGYYFITTVTENRDKILGFLEDDEVVLTQYGEICKNCWLELTDFYHNLQIDEFVIMPEHIHGILEITDTDQPVDCSKHDPDISRIMQYFKTQTGKKINQIQNTPGKRIWQRSFYDHLIRNEDELSEVREYILNNPYNIQFDKYS